MYTMTTSLSYTELSVCLCHYPLQRPYRRKAFSCSRGKRSPALIKTDISDLAKYIYQKSVIYHTK